MVDVTVTANEVLAVSGAGGTGLMDGTLGEAVTAGKLVIKSADDGLIYLADCTDADLDEVIGMAMTSGAAGQTIKIGKSGLIDPGFTVTPGTVYVLSESGGIAPVADLASADYVSVAGVGITATRFKFILENTGVQVPA